MVCVHLAIPVLNPREEQWPIVLAALRDLAATPGFRWWFTIVDDGSRQFIPPAELLAMPGVTILRQPRNLGKGAALRRAVLEGPQDCDLFAFTDFDIPYGTEQLVIMLKYLLFTSYDIVIGDRTLRASRYGGSLPQTRAWSHRLFRLLVRTLIAGGITDSQAGLKVFEAKAARELARVSVIDGFLFDVEWLNIALTYNLTVGRLPLQIAADQVSSGLIRMRPLTVVRDFLRIIRRKRHAGYNTPELEEWSSRKVRQALEIFGEV